MICLLSPWWCSYCSVLALMKVFLTWWWLITRLQPKGVDFSITPRWDPSHFCNHVQITKSMPAYWFNMHTEGHILLKNGARNHHSFWRPELCASCAMMHSESRHFRSTEMGFSGLFAVIQHLIVPVKLMVNVVLIPQRTDDAEWCIYFCSSSCSHRLERGIRGLPPRRVWGSCLDRAESALRNVPPHGRWKSPWRICLHRLERLHQP